MEGFEELDVLDSERSEDRSADRKTPDAGSLTAVRGRLVWFHDDPFLVGTEKAMRYEEDGLMICQDGRITYAGPYESGRNSIPPDAAFTHYPNHIISPGFVDSHVHFTQVGMIASYGERLLNWLQDYVYPEEMKYSDKGYAEAGARLFCDDLLRNGTTTALVFTSTYPGSVNALFKESSKRGMRMAAGKVLMDTNAPQELCDASVEKAMKQTRKLIERWHGKDRNVYAVMPRFPLACTREMLKAAGELWGELRKEYPGLLMHSHIAENTDEVFEGRKAFPEFKTYLDVFRHYGLLGPGAVLAHGVHLTEKELKICHETKSAIAHCPTSNLFLGSGLFPLRDAKTPKRPVGVGLGTDVGGGTSLSMLATMDEAYKVSALDEHPADAIRLFYLATLGGAKALRMHKKIGRLEPGYEADFIVLDPKATPLLAKRTETGDGSIEDLLFALAILGDDRAVEATYVAGRLAHKRDRGGDKKNMGDHPFAWSRYDWQTQSWLPDRTTGFRGWMAPSIDAYAGGLHCVYLAPDSTLQWTVYTQQDQEPGEWSAPQSLGVKTGAGPSIAPYHDHLYVCYRDYPSKRIYTKRCDDEGVWESPRLVPGDIETHYPPAITAFNDFLYLLVRDEDQWISCNTYCSKTDAWSGWKQLWRVDSYDPVTIAAYAGRLYVMYVPDFGADLKWTAYDLATGDWWPHRTLENTAETARPKLAHYNGLLYAMGVRWQGDVRETWWAKQGADLPEWTTPEVVPEIHPYGYGPGLTPYHGQLYSAYFMG
ncbi:guanine deaminase [Nocardiopsis mangrovi]|uniref:Guanine deaminase n=1 Tax=Nocardiopsis mangrovi TaxID=1179818 RepID=A0ABV9E4W3_9ACTN